MPRYHFHLEATAGPSADADGREMVDDAAAVQEAGSTAGTVLMDELTDGRSKPRVVVTVERSDGIRVAVVRAYAEVETF